MTASDRYQWQRDKDGLGVREHRGKVAVAGLGHSPVDRREIFAVAGIRATFRDKP